MNELVDLGHYINAKGERLRYEGNLLGRPAVIM